MRCFLITTGAVLVLAVAAAAQEEFERLRFHAAPRPLAEGAVTADWPHLLGPAFDASTAEAPLLADWPAGGPAKVWEVEMGEGYAAPAVAGGRVYLFHALDGRETLECLDAGTGRRHWLVDYPVEYRDRYGFSNGPRGSPVVGDGVVVTLGVTSVLQAVDAGTGALLWRKDLRELYRVPQDFFGHGSTPLVLDDRVIVQVGGKTERMDPADSKRERAAKLATAGVSVAAFGLREGGVLWELPHAWGASYASPVPAEMHGRRVVLVFAGGESDPPTGGLLCVDPTDGTLLSQHPWRANDYISATASSPVVIPGKNRVFVTTCYPKNRPLGGVMIEYDAAFQGSEVWTSSRVGVHWMTPVWFDGHLYAVDGERENNSRLVCVDAETGAEVWEKTLMWEDAELAARLGRSSVNLGFLRGSLLRCGDRFLALGELGTLMWLKLDPSGCEVLGQCQPFYALNTWALPVVSGGLLYLCQQGDDIDPAQKAGPRVLCLDLRGP
jgi:outer membrane protein assembly factor BamB